MKRVAAAIVVSLVCAAGGCGDPVSDPTSDPDEGSSFEIGSEHSWGIEAQIGKPFTDGLEVLKVDGTETVRLIRVELVGSTGIRLTAAYLHGYACPPR